MDVIEVLQINISPEDICQEDKIRLKLIKLGNLFTGDFMLKKIKPVLLILFFLVMYIYVCNITLLLSNIIVFQ